MLLDVDGNAVALSGIGTITLTNGELVVDSSLSIDGDRTNDGTPDITIDAQGNSRVFNINDGNNNNFSSVTLEALTITGGSAAGNGGGGIYNREDLTISNSTISGNSAAFDGGGVSNRHSTATIGNSTISGNSASDDGGGVSNFRSTATIVNSSIIGNSVSDDGGGVSNNQSTVTIANSSISGNSASDGGGGGIHSYVSTVAISSNTISGNSAYGGGGVFNSVSTVTINNSTISGNSVAFDGGGIFNFYSTANVASTIIAGNGNDIAGNSAFTSNGNNLIGNGEGASGFTNGDNNDIVGTSTAPIAPGLDPNGLQDNGGPTQTIALVAGSPAINAGSNPDSLTTDQRGTGFDRVSGLSADIGAFERQIPIVTLSVSPTTASEADTTTLTITVTASEAVSGDQTVALDVSGTGITADDFDGSIPDTLTIVDGATTASVMVAIADDSSTEGDETASFAISNPSGGLTLGTTTTVEVAIADNDNQTIVVDTLIDENDGDLSAGDISLREALAAVAPGGTITFANSLLTADEGLGVGVIGLDGTELAIAQSVTINGDIDGDGTGDITIDALGNSRVLNINDGDNNSESEVSLSGLTITGGSASGDGGGIFNRESLAIAVSTISGNSASSKGGGIFNSASLSIANSTISGNTASFYGGGISNDRGRSTIANSTISGNSARTAGGGIANIRGRSTIANSTISGNSGSAIGGGIFNNRARSTIANSTISDNLAGYGGGIANNYTTHTIIANSTISGNSATNANGGGISNLVSNGLIANSTISGNSASDNGGGIFNSGGTSEIANSTISGNSAGNDGGGIFNNDRTNYSPISNSISNSIIAGNTASSGNEIKLVSGTVNADANNLLGDSSQTNSEAFDGFSPDVSGTSDIIATSDNSSVDGGVALSDILNSTLTDNGGSTPTLALVDGSPAIDAGDNTAAINLVESDLGVDLNGDDDTDDTLTQVSELAFDQRGTGFDRIQGGSVDIGAFESSFSTVPEITSVATASVAENQTSAIDVDAADNSDSEGNGLTYTITGGTDAALFNIDAAMGVVTFINAPDFENPGDANNDNQYGLQVTVTDTTGFTDTQDITITVTDVAEAASTFVVTTLADEAFGGGSLADELADGDGLSLREAIALADTNDPGTADTIVFAGDVTEAAAIDLRDAAGNVVMGDAGTITLTNRTLVVDSSLTIDGDRTNDGTPDITIDAQGNSGIFIITDGSESTVSNTVTINGLTITGGTSSRGGGIINGEDLTLSNSIISRNSANYGGGIYNAYRGIATIRNSTISGNSANVGGGLYNVLASTATIDSSTISSNSVGFNGGGIFSDGSTIAINNSTISGNTANYIGGGVHISGRVVTISNSTLSGNSAGEDGGGVFNSDGSTANIVSTIIAGNTATLSGPDVNGAFTDDGNNLIGDAAGSTGFTTSTLVGSSVSPIDPLLGLLQNNGGSTETQALQIGSPAINAGRNPNAITTDQRGTGFNRVIGSSADIGAFELQSVISIPTVTLSVSPTTASEASTTPLTLTVTASEAVSGAQTVALDVSGTGITADDFDATIPDTLTIDDGETTASFEVAIADDSSVEGDETASFAISNPSSGLTLGATTSVEVAIADNDVAPPTDDAFLFSLQNGATLNGVSTTPLDIILFDGSDFALYFNGADVGLSGASIRAFDTVTNAATGNTEILMAFNTPTSVPGVSGTVDDSDIVRFTATSLGENTAGTFSLEFDGSDVGLSSSGEKIDALTSLADGSILFSTTGNLTVNGSRIAGDEDVVKFTPIALGTGTSGSFSVEIDNSAAGLSSDIDAFSQSATNENLFSTPGSVSSLGVADEDVFSFGSGVFFDGSQFGLGSNDITGIDLTFTAPSTTPAEQLSLSLAVDSIAEDGGSTIATITRTGDVSADLSVSLSSSDTSEVTVDNTVVIPAGNDSATFPVTIINDDDLDGDQTATITASASGFTGASANLEVTDDEVAPTVLSVTLADDSIPENGGSTQVTISRTGDLSVELSVTLTSNDLTEAEVPSPVVIAANEDSVTVQLDAVDDIEIDGTQTVTITASAATANSDSDTIQITDNETVPTTDDALLFSLENAAALGGVATTPLDIVQYDGTNFSVYFNGADVGLSGVSIRAFDTLTNTTTGATDILMAFSAPTTVPGITGTVDESDIVRFSATRLGATTAGTFSLEFDGSDVGLSSSGEKIDALTGQTDGTLLFSTVGNLNVGGVRIAGDEDVVQFSPTSLGTDTAGIFSVEIDNSTAGLSSDIDAFSQDAAGENVFSTPSAVSSLGVGDEDAFNLTSGVFFDGSQFGLSGNDITGVDLSFTAI